MIDVQQNVPLAPLTTLRIGGNARYFAVAQTEADVAEAFEFAQENRVEVFVLGGGSNVLISDNGFDGLVIRIALSGITGGNASVNERADSDDASQNINSSMPDGTLVHTRVSARSGDFLTAEAGEDWDEFVAYCIQNNLAGVECLSGIPGLVGGTPVQNVGAYGQEVSETITSVRCFDRETREVVVLTNAECNFTYRTSIFNSTMRDQYVVLSVTFALTRGGKAKIVYKDLIEHFKGRKPTLLETRETVLNIRRAKSMVIDPADPNSKSAGSFFENPIVERSKLDEIACTFPNIPSFDFGDKVKIPAAWLIENAGFHKGQTHGNAGISGNHTLALINRNNASAEDLISLKTAIQTAVQNKFGIELIPEPVFVGFDLERPNN